MTSLIDGVTSSRGEVARNKSPECSSFGESLESNSYIRCVGRRITNINRYVWLAAKVYKNDTPTRVHKTEGYIHRDRWDPG